MNEMKRIHDDASLLPQMFRLEANERNIINKTKTEAENTAREALANRDRMQNRINDLESELDRKKQLSIQAIAARSNVKRHLDQAQTKITELDKKLEVTTKRMEEAEQQKSDAIEKHDEMFNSVSALNQRIEELEQHKLHLL